MDGDERHTPIGVVRPLRDVIQFAARLRHIATDARRARRQMLDPLLARNDQGRTEAHNTGDLRLDRKQQGKDRPHRVPHDGDVVTRTTQNRVAVTHRVHPVLMLRTAEILCGRPVPCKSYGKHRKSAHMKVLPHETQLSGKPCESMNEEDAMPSARQEKRLCAQ